MKIGGLILLGTIVNTVVVIVGSCVGLLIKGGIKKRYKDIIMQALALCIMFIGASTAIGGLNNTDAEPVLFIISLVIGSAFGEFINIENKLQNIGDMIQNKIGSKESNISQGFVTTSLMFCVGTMAILGSLESGIQGVHTTLFAKSVLDGTSAIIFASTLGIGVIFSAVSIFLYQGTLTILASFIQPYLTGDMMREITIVGGIMIFAIGLNLMEIKKIRVGNMLPAIIIPVLYYLPFVQNIFNSIAGLF